MGDGRILLKTGRDVSLIKIYRMSLISTGSISLDRTFNNIQIIGLASTVVYGQVPTLKKNYYTGITIKIVFTIFKTAKQIYGLNSFLIRTGNKEMIISALKKQKIRLS